MIKKDLVITYSYAKAEFVKRHLKDFGLNAFTKCVTLESLYTDELDEFMLTYIIKQELGDVECSDFIYAYRQDLDIKDEYKDSFLKVKKACDELRKRFNLKCGFADVSDFNDIYVDEFYVDNICLYNNKFEEDFINNLNAKALKKFPKNNQIPKIYTYKDKITSIHEEVKLALSLAREFIQNKFSFRFVATSLSIYSRYFELYKTMAKIDVYSYHKSIVIDNDLLEQKTNAYMKKYEKYFSNLNKDFIKEYLSKNLSKDYPKNGIRLEELSEFIGSNELNERVILLGLDFENFPINSSDNVFLKKDIYKYNSYEFSKAVYENLKQNTKELYLLSTDYLNAKSVAKSIICKDDFTKAKFLKKRVLKDCFAFSPKVAKPVKLECKMSASKYNTLRLCPKRFLYESALGIKNDELEQSDLEPNEKGTIMHSCFEYIVKGWGDSFNKQNLAKNSIDLAFDDFLKKEKNGLKELNIYMKIYKNKLLKGISNDDEPSAVAKFLKYYEDYRSENNINDTKTEFEFFLDKDLNPSDENNYYIKGFIDRLDIGDDFINIVDYKSSKKDKIDEKRMEQIKSYEDFQLGLYLLYASKKYPNMKYYKASLLTFNTKNLKTEFAFLEYSQEYLKGLEQEIKKLDEFIQKGEFKAKENDNCKYCPINNICDKGTNDE
ncbi:MULTISPECIES: PD-(D/E)XK nuclease family protein [unclassified Campylobacter]|uniref:PD-(D/E)XK nuclease family protein n=1 Tax=unclassified Campylobacter TaxID=2593542 RepID=UPI001BDA3EBB|nr:MULTISPECIES: PD-(D/E)XK nuclease family protein [unclassified Campylobacter]MBT0879771.1 PD-(D/E)XK nuclease family protein [Campylobacter sp. 2018MI27]MBT0885119.1 PD-(D/E)XK nuclease family protein [Campylobacter sp. 2018MI10]